MKLDLKKSFEEMRQALRTAQDFVIAGHVSPDGDAIGSCLSLAMTIQKLGGKARVLLEPFHPKFQVIPGMELIYRGPLEEINADVFFCMDCGTPDRLGAAAAVQQRARLTACIDHHSSHTPFCRINALDPDASSTSELVYECVAPLTEMDKDTASAIYAGIICDTGGFRHGCTSPRTLQIAADLVGLGIPFSLLYNELLRKHSVTETLIFRAALENMSFTAQNRIADSVLSYETLSGQGAGGQDLDGIVEYLLNIRDVKVSALFYEKEPGEIKVSLRSESMDVSRTAMQFGGGGHIHAAGCLMRGDMREIRQRMLQALGETGG